MHLYRRKTDFKDYKPLIHSVTFNYSCVQITIVTKQGTETCVRKKSDSFEKYNEIEILHKYRRKNLALQINIFNRNR